MYEFEEISQGLRQHVLSVEGNERFDSFWEQFFDSDLLNPDVFKRKKGRIEYLCDHHIPTKKDGRKPLFLLFGNSTPHSILGELYFAWEGNKREHRMWKLFDEAGIFRFDFGIAETLEARNKIRKKSVFDLGYESPFRVGMDVFYSIPSTPSRPPWSGVAGVKKLLGAKAFRGLAEHEKERLAGDIGDFLQGRGAVIAFQKDAYEGIVSDDSPRYALAKAISGELVGKAFFDESVSVYAVAPTRFLNGGEARRTLIALIENLL